MLRAAMSPSDEYPARRIFVISTLALFTAGLSFSLRAAIIAAIEAEILAPLDPMHSGALAGTLLGTAFLGFAATLALGSAVLDRFGMGRMLAAAGLCFAFGTKLVIAASLLAEGAAVYTLLRAGFRGDFVLQHYFDQQPELETERSLSFVQQLIESAKMEAA